MIWSLVTNEDMNSYGTSPVFGFYSEVLGRDNVKLAVVDDDDSLDFVSAEDTILLRTASRGLVHTIEKKGLKSTAEFYPLYELTNDKKTLSDYLAFKGIGVPRQYHLDEVKDGNRYFVKPRYGNESKCISENSVCSTIDEVIRQVSIIKETLNQDAVIEEFIDGVESTSALVCIDGNVSSCSIDIEFGGKHGIQTKECKSGFLGYCKEVPVEFRNRVNAVARDVFKTLHIHHHARIDMRRDKDGNVFVIDVNLLPGLSPIGLFSRSYSVSLRASYWFVINSILSTATY